MRNFLIAMLVLLVLIATPDLLAAWMLYGHSCVARDVLCAVIALAWTFFLVATACVIADWARNDRT